MKLFYSPGACSLSPHIVLMEAGVKFQSEKVDLKAKTYSGGDYKKINPKGSVPAIQFDNGDVLTEGAVIVQYLADQKPETGLMPKVGTPERYHAMEMLNYIATEIHKGFSPLFGADRMVPNKEGNEQLRNFARENLGAKLTVLSDKLGTKNYLLGDHFTAPDAYLFTVLNWAPKNGVDLSKWPVIQKYMERVAARPKVQAAMRDEGLIN